MSESVTDRRSSARGKPVKSAVNHSLSAVNTNATGIRRVRKHLLRSRTSLTFTHSSSFVRGRSCSGSCLSVYERSRTRKKTRIACGCNVTKYLCNVTKCLRDVYSGVLFVLAEMMLTAIINEYICQTSRIKHNKPSYQ